MRPAVLNAISRTVPIALTGAVMLVLSWRKWADLIVDYGREVYVPWRLSKGAVLYRDIASYYGPLSNYLNAALFRLFGESLIVLQLFNILLVALLTCLIYRLLEREDDRTGSVAASCAFLVLFAFARHFKLGSYNYVAPYSHELVHGVFLAFAAIHALKLFVTRGKPVWVFLTGLFTGLVLVTKMEIAFALVLAVSPAIVAALRNEGPGRDRAFSLLGLFAAGALMPAFLFIAFFSVHMGVGEAVKSVFSSWTVVAGTDISTSRFYQAVTGTDNLLSNIGGMLTMTLWYLAVLIPPPLAADYLLRNNSFARKYGPVLAFVVTGGLLICSIQRIPWDLIFWPLPLFAAAIAVFFGVKTLKGGDPVRTVPLFALSVFSAALLVKILFVTRIYGYGFVLAMPATLLMIYMLASHVPAGLSKSYGGGGIFRASALAAISVMLLLYFIKSYSFYKDMDYAVGSGGDTIIASKHTGGEAVGILLEQINRVMAPEDDFIMLPEGTLMNYLSKRDKPTRYLTFLPSDMTIYGEGRILTAMEKSPPDYIILISRDTSEYGPHYLGQGYGEGIFSFIKGRYSDVVRIGNMGFLDSSTTGQPLGIVIMKRDG